MFYKPFQQYIGGKSGNIVTGKNNHIRLNARDKLIHQIECFIIVSEIAPQLQVGKHQNFKLLVAGFQTLDVFNGKFAVDAPDVHAFFTRTGNKQSQNQNYDNNKQRCHYADCNLLPAA